MTDSNLQQVKRNWAGSGSIEDAVEYLHKRMRIGGLSREAVELSANFGFPPARRICGLPRSEPVTVVLETADRLGYERPASHHETAVRLAIAAFRDVVRSLSPALQLTLGTALDHCALILSRVEYGIENASLAPYRALADRSHELRSEVGRSITIQCGRPSALRDALIGLLHGAFPRYPSIAGIDLHIACRDWPDSVRAVLPKIWNRVLNEPA